MSSPPIQWYPGHIAKAEKQLKEQLKKVDVVLEILDARIPLASHHPQVDTWIGAKPKILVLNRQDMIADRVAAAWQQWYQQQDQTPFLTNAQQGKGVKAIAKAAGQFGKQINARRRSRGMMPRPVRAVVIGFPNVGKSALINRLVGRKVVESARRAGITRQLRWVRISDEIELLDAPGVIPVRLDNQADAVKLAICEDIGEAAYDNQLIAAEMVDLFLELDLAEVLRSRYQLSPLGLTGDQYLHQLADLRFQADSERTARALLQDFRKGSMGQISLELPPIVR